MVRDRRLNRPPRWSAWLFALAPTAVVIGFAVIPALALTIRAVGDLSDSAAIEAGRTITLVTQTLTQATVSTLLTVAIGLAPGIVIARHRFAGRSVLLSALTAVFVLPTVVMAAGVRAAMPGRWESGWVPIIAAHVVFNLAVVIRFVGSAPSPTSLERVARTLGASPIAVLRTVTLPLVAPALGAASAVVFALTFTSYGIVRILGGVTTTTLEVEIWRQTVLLGRIERGVMLSVLQVLLLVTAGAVVAQIRRRRHPVEFVEEPRTSATRAELLTLIPVVVLVAIPVIALVVGSFRVGTGFGMSAWRSIADTSVRDGLALGIDPIAAMVTSARTAAVAAVMAVGLGLAVVAAGAIDQTTGRIVDALVMTPLGISAVTIGLGILITFDTAPFDWRAGPLIVPLGHALVATPFIVRPMIAAARSVDSGRIDAASTLGATPLRALVTALGPVTRPALLTGAGLAAAISLGEFGATSLLSRTGSETLPIVIERLLTRTGGDFRARAHALAVVLTAAVMMVTIGLNGVVSRRRRLQ